MDYLVFVADQRDSSFEVSPLLFILLSGGQTNAHL